MVNQPSTSERRSREGAWIEIVAVDKSKVGFCVAPVRERGLKFLGIKAFTINNSRSREGAWIEILIRPYGHKYSKSLP